MCRLFSSCKKKNDPEKSKACDIVKFTAGDKDWDISGTSVTAIFAKGTVVNSLMPTITVSPGATVDPKSGTVQDFSSDKTVTYIVTAEDGVTKKLTQPKQQYRQEIRMMVRCTVWVENLPSDDNEYPSRAGVPKSWRLLFFML